MKCQLRNAKTLWASCLTVAPMHCSGCHLELTRRSRRAADSRVYGFFSLYGVVWSVAVTSAATPTAASACAAIAICLFVDYVKGCERYRRREHNCDDPSCSLLAL